ncbi:MAG: hypothetical protein Q7T24_03600 [Deltaproteobacteria bacterium]|nr:hypothetical protein [Deltaproteobacteria bacterium]
MREIRQKPFTSYLPYLLLFAGASVLYWKTVSFDFIPSWDDKEYILDNTYIQALSIENLKSIFSSSYFANYAPLHILSYSVDFALWELNPKGYHLTNVILHGLNACLAYAAIKKLTGDGKTAVFSAVLFAVHPLNVENVAWVSERKTLLTAFFSFLSIISYLSFRDRGAWGLYMLSAVFFILALLSKPLTVVLPLVFLSFEVFLKKDKRGWAYSVPLFFISVLAAVIAFRAHLGHSSIKEETLASEVLFGTVYPTMLPVFWKYLKLILWPFNLSGFYDAPIYHSFLNPAVAASLAGIILLFFLIIRKGGGQARFWLFWFWIWVSPVSNIIPLPVYYADRYMYMPAISLFVLAASVIKAIAKKPPCLTAKTLSYSVFIIITVFYAAIAFGRMDAWRSELAFWKDTAEKSPNQDKAHLNLGYSYEMAGMLDEAESEYLKAVNIYPSPEAVSNLEMVRVKKSYKKNSITPP